MKGVRNLTAIMATALCAGWACTSTAGSGANGAHAEEAPASTTRPAAEPGPAPGHAWVIFGTDTVVVEVARTEEQREQGLMYRQELPDGTGMLFVFDDEQVRSFWMQNTYVALDIAFLDVSLRVVDIEQMEPMTTDPHDSKRPSMFAVELPKGWCAAHGVKVGDQAKVEFGP